MTLAPGRNSVWSLLLLCVTVLAAGALAGSTNAGPATGSEQEGVSLPGDSLSARRSAEAVVRRYVRAVVEADEEGPWPEPVGRRPEPPHVVERRYLTAAEQRRPALIAALDELAEAAPADDWIAGHRVGLRIKQGWTAEAVEVARDCRAAPWWCQALLGFALHVSGRIPEAEASFDGSLASMPEAVRCAWAEELLPTLEEELRRRFASADCAERLGIEPRIWWLADPLQIVPGNDRRTEQFARMVAMQLHHETLALRSGGTGVCGRRHHMTVLLGGWQNWWWTMVPLSLDRQRGGFPFLPSGVAWIDPFETTSSDWASDFRIGGERYLPPYGSVHPLPRQTAFFLRGDSILAATASELSGPMRFAGVAMSRNENAPPILATDSLVSGPVRFEVRVPRDAYLVSVEAKGLGGEAYRTRFGHRLPEPNVRGLAISDLALLDPELSPAEVPGDPLQRMLGTDLVESGRPLGVYFEIYGAPGDAAFDLHLTVRPEERGILRRIGEGLQLLAPRTPISVRWQETFPAHEATAKELRLDLPELPDGSYRLELVVDDRSGEPVGAYRRLEVIGG